MENNNIFDSCTNSREDNQLYLARYAFENIVKDAFAEFFAGSGLTIKDNYRGYYYDSYTRGTQTQNDVNIFYVELKSPYKDNTNGKKSVIFAPNYTLEMIKNEIFNILVNVSNKDTLLWKTRYSINLSYFEQMQENSNSEDLNKKNDESKDNTSDDNNNQKPEKHIINFRIIIGESYKGKSSYGIKYYAKNGGSERIQFPMIALENYMYKNHKTKNNYMYYANLIKNIVAGDKKKSDLANSEIIESMLYNLPNQFFNEKPKVAGLRNIINYLKNYPLQDYLTIDNKYKLFLTENNNFSILDGKDIIKIVEKYYINSFA